MPFVKLSGASPAPALPGMLPETPAAAVGPAGLAEARSAISQAQQWAALIREARGLWTEIAPVVRPFLESRIAPAPQVVTPSEGPGLPPTTERVIVREVAPSSQPAEDEKARAAREEAEKARADIGATLESMPLAHLRKAFFTFVPFAFADGFEKTGAVLFESHLSHTVALVEALPEDEVRAGFRKGLPLIPAKNLKLARDMLRTFAAECVKEDAATPKEKGEEARFCTCDPGGVKKGCPEHDPGGWA